MPRALPIARPGRLRRSTATLLLAALGLLFVASARAQTIIAFPFEHSLFLSAPRPSTPANERPPVATTPAPHARSVQRVAAVEAKTAVSLPAPEPTQLFDPDIVETLSAMLAPAPAWTTLSSFSGNPADGGIRSGTTWTGQVTQNAASITVSGSARDDNGWGATGLSIDASNLGYLNITAQRDPGHATSSLFVQFEDRLLNTHVESVDASVFAIGTLSLVQLTLDPWTSGFDPTQIISWSIGGGGLGMSDFRMTFEKLELTNVSAIPEPAATWLVGIGIFTFVLARRLKKRPPPGS